MPWKLTASARGELAVTTFSTTSTQPPARTPRYPSLPIWRSERCNVQSALQSINCRDSRPDVFLLQEKVENYLNITRGHGREIKNELRNSRAYRNPDFLQKMVEHAGIKEFGSNFPADVFDPEHLHEDVRGTI